MSDKDDSRGFYIFGAVIICFLAFCAFAIWVPLHTLGEVRGKLKESEKANKQLVEETKAIKAKMALLFKIDQRRVARQNYLLNELTPVERILKDIESYEDFLKFYAVENALLTERLEKHKGKKGYPSTKEWLDGRKDLMAKMKTAVMRLRVDGGEKLIENYKKVAEDLKYWKESAIFSLAKAKIEKLGK